MSFKRVVRAVVPHAIWERLRQAKIRSHVRSFKPYVVSRRYGQTSLKIRICDNLSRGWYDRDWQELPEIELLSRSRLRPGALVFDCGAHHGVVALMLLSRVSPGGRVVAVEGMVHNCTAARKNAELNDANGRLTVVHAAVSSGPGKVRFSDDLNGRIAADGIGSVVDAVTIDQLADRFGMPDVLFVDVEGFELEALKGACRVLESGCDVYVEVHVGAGLEAAGGSAKAVADCFDPEQYERWVWCTDGGVPELLNDESFVRVSKARFCLVARRRQEKAEAG